MKYKHSVAFHITTFLFVLWCSFSFVVYATVHAHNHTNRTIDTLRHIKRNKRSEKYTCMQIACCHLLCVAFSKLPVAVLPSCSTTLYHAIMNQSVCYWIVIPHFSTATTAAAASTITIGCYHYYLLHSLCDSSQSINQCNHYYYCNL